MPTWLLKQSVELLAPFLCQLFNWTLEHGIVPSTFKYAYITPILKKSDLDPADVKSYRPISNLSVLSKLLKRLASSEISVTETITETKIIDPTLTETVETAMRWV